MKTGLVLEGGAMRGLFTAGVLDVLLENKINFDGYQLVQPLVSIISRNK